MRIENPHLPRSVELFVQAAELAVADTVNQAGGSAVGGLELRTRNKTARVVRGRRVLVRVLRRTLWHCSRAVAPNWDIRYSQGNDESLNGWVPISYPVLAAIFGCDHSALVYAHNDPDPFADQMTDAVLERLRGDADVAAGIIVRGRLPDVPRSCGMLEASREPTPAPSPRRPVILDGQPCDHPGCLNHVTHPCEGCGRIAGKGSTPRRRPVVAELGPPASLGQVRQGRKAD